VTVPANATAEVWIPVCDPPQVSESGIPADSAEGVTFLRTEGTSNVYEVQSGVYSFSSRIQNCDIVPVPAWWVY